MSCTSLSLSLTQTLTVAESERSHDKARMARYRVQFTQVVINPSVGEGETRGW